MAQLETVNLVFGASQSAPNTITYNQAIILTKLAEQFNAGNITGSCSGWITVDRLYKSQYVLLRNLGVNIASPTFENCLDDNFTIDSILNKTIYEGQSIALSSNNISNDVLTYSMNSSTDIAIVSKDETTTDSYIKGRINLRNNSIVVQSASQNDSWTVRVTIHATPTYNYIDNNGQRQIVQGNSVATVLTVTATAVTDIIITGPDMVNAGETVVYNATLMPAASTKTYSSVTLTSLQDGFINYSNSYKINGDNPTDTITATVTLYGSTLNASKNIILGVELLNDDDKNPQMFGIIKSALNLDEDKHSFSVIDAMDVDDSGGEAIWLKLLELYSIGTVAGSRRSDNIWEVNSVSGYAPSFEEFKYFTSIQNLKLTSDIRKGVEFNGFAFPINLKECHHIGLITTGDLTLPKDLYYGDGISNNSALRCLGTLHIPGNIRLHVSNSGSTRLICDKLDAAKGIILNATSHSGSSQSSIKINNSDTIVNFEDMPKYTNANGIQYILPNTTTLIIPDGVQQLPCFRDCPNLKYFRTSAEGNDSVNLPSFVKTINDDGFKNCVGLNIQLFGENMLNIGTNSFEGCLGCFTNNNVRISYSATVTKLKNNILNIFGSNRNVLLKLIGVGITELSEYRGSATTALCWLDIRGLNNLTTFGGGLGWNIPFLDLTKQNRIVSLGYSALNNNVQRIYVPDALVANYKAATNWSNNASKIYGESQFIADALATGVGNWDSTNNEWITHPYDDDYTYGLPTWTLAADV